MTSPVVDHDRSRGVEHSAEVRRRAWHVWYLSTMQRRGFRTAALLGLIAIYSITFMWGGFFDWAGWTETILWSLAAVLWIVILVIYVRQVVHADHRIRFMATHLSLPLLLIAPAFLWLTWFPLGAFILVVIAYVLELRNHSAGDGFLFSFGLVIFIGLFAGLSMVEVEHADPESQLKTPADGLLWAFASVLKINYGKSITPETHEGRILATVVGICAILGASLFTATVVTWVIGKKDDAEAADVAEEKAQADSLAEATSLSRAGDPTATSTDVAAELAQIRQELAELRALLVRTAGSSGSPPADGQVQ